MSATKIEQGWREYSERLDWPSKGSYRGESLQAQLQTAFGLGAEGRPLARPFPAGSPQILAWDAGRRFARAKMKAVAVPMDDAKEPRRVTTLPQCPLCLKAYRCEGCRKAHQECECKNGNLFADHPTMPAAAPSGKRSS